MSRFLHSIATAAVGVTLGTSSLQAGSAQAASFYDFNIQWQDNTTTTGWVQVDDTPDEQGSVTGSYNVDYRIWALESLLDASFTHEGTAYGKSDLTTLVVTHYDIPADSAYFPLFGNVFDEVRMNFGSWFLLAADSAVEDLAFKSTPDTFISATSVRLTERTATAVPEPVATVDLTLTGAGIVVTHRKKHRKIAA